MKNPTFKFCNQGRKAHDGKGLVLDDLARSLRVSSSCGIWKWEIDQLNPKSSVIVQGIQGQEGECVDGFCGRRDLADRFDSDTLKGLERAVGSTAPLVQTWQEAPPTLDCLPVRHPTSKGKDTFHHLPSSLSSFSCYLGKARSHDCGRT